MSLDALRESLRAERRHLEAPIEEEELRRPLRDRIRLGHLEKERPRVEERIVRLEATAAPLREGARGRSVTADRHPPPANQGSVRSRWRRMRSIASSMASSEAA